MSQKKIKVGNLTLGGEKIYVQSMLSKPAHDVNANVDQAIQLANAGCDIIRVSIPELSDVRLIDAIKNEVSVPIVADIHFDYKIAIEAVNAGADKIRINPGNIGSAERTKAVVDACRNKNVPIRVGVNSGSIERSILAKYGSPTVEAMVESGVETVKLLESYDFDKIVVAMKSSDVRNTICAYRMLAKRVEYPLHIGITEAGTQRIGLIKSAVGIGSLLCDGIGDTLRVSLTADPIEEVRAGIDILKAIGLYENNVEIISCPTCGRTKIDLLSLVKEVEEATSELKKSLKIAVMGCAVNGPGEAREADIGVAGGDGVGIIFKKGEIVKKVKEDELLSELLNEIEKDI